MFKTLFFLFTLLAKGKEFTQWKISWKKENKKNNRTKAPKHCDSLLNF